MGDMILHIGCENKYYEGMINSDVVIDERKKPRKLDMVMDVSKPWPYKDNSVDGIISMHVLQQLVWRDLVFAMKEAYRVLKIGGVMRLGVPAIENDKPLEYLLGWNNVNLFSVDLLSNVLSKIGFLHVKLCHYQESKVPQFIKVDNRPEETIYLEVVK